MLQLTEALLNEIRRHGERAYPNECCGVLLGHAGEGAKKVTALFPVENASDPAEQYHRYLITPETYMQADKQARAGGCEILGFYHSHPDDAARPSNFDREYAWPWYSYIVVSVRQGQAVDLHSWLLADDRKQFDPEEIRISDE